MKAAKITGGNTLGQQRQKLKNYFSSMPSGWKLGFKLII